MPTIDLRTRFSGDAVDLDPHSFNGDYLAELPDDRWADAGAAATALKLLPLTLEVDGHPLTLEVDEDGRLRVQRRSGGAVVVTLARDAFSDFVQDVVSAIWLTVSGRATVTCGEATEFFNWEPVLRHLLDGRRVYQPGSITFTDRRGRPMNPRRTFTRGDDPAELGHFLAEAGYLHLAGVFTEAEMAAVSADLDAAMAAAQREDGSSWWARTESDTWYPARILAFNQKSAALRDLLRSDRLTSIATYTDDDLVADDPDAGDAANGLLKKVGVVEGISDLAWHKDCGAGSHSRTCCGLVVGISVTGAGPENGGIEVVAGSHRANVSPLLVDQLDLPKLALPTRTGDVTVHCTCTLHMSRPPVSVERRVVYTGFKLAPRPGDRAPATPEDKRRERLGQNDHVRRWQSDNGAAAGTDRVGETAGA